MDLGDYTKIIFCACFLPSMIFFIGGSIWCWCRRRDASLSLMLMVMKTFTRMNINGKLTYLFCGRKLPSGHIYKCLFCISSLYQIAMCIQLFFFLAIVDQTYNCINDPEIDCFKKKDDLKITDTYAYHESPVNCSSISPDDFVICYRLTVFDPERAFIAAAAAYLLFKMLNFGFFIVSYIMLWMAKKWEGKTLLRFKLLLCLIFTLGMNVPLILRFFLDEVESAFRQIPQTILFQSGILTIAIFCYILFMPWRKFKYRKEHFGVGSDRYSDDSDGEGDSDSHSDSDSDNDSRMDNINNTGYRTL